MRNDFETGYLAHSAKGRTWKNHKYIAKHPLGNGLYKYFYTQAELDAFLKKKGGGTKVELNSQIGAKNYDPNAAKKSTTNLKASSDNTSKVKAELVARNKTTNANKKTASEVTLSETKEQQAKGKEAADKLLKSQTSSDSTKNSSKSSDSSKKSGKSSGSSKKSSGGKSSSGSSKKGSSGSKKSGSSKEKTQNEKAAKSEKTNNTSKQKTNIKTKKLSTMESIMMDHSVTSLDVSSFSGSSNDFKKSLLKKYEDGSSGYLSAGDNVYKFIVENGDVILKDYVTNKEVSFDKYLKDARSFKEFAINKKKK